MDLCTKGALHEMVVPSLLAIVVPVVTGLILGAEGNSCVVLLMTASSLDIARTTSVSHGFWAERWFRAYAKDQSED